MCNEVRRRIALGQLREDWGQTRVPLVFPEGAPNMAPLDSIRITDSAAILRTAPADDAAPPGAGGAPAAALVTRRWSWPGPTGKPVYNYRSEVRTFANAPRSGRCLIPVDGFFEFTDPAPGAKGRRKTRWLFTDPRHPWFCIAGFWRHDDAVGEAFTMLTCDPGPDIAPYHHRQVVVPAREHWPGWLDGSLPAAEVLRPSPAGTLHVAPAG